MAKKVLVSGCYDLLHSGHVEFFQQASQYGDLCHPHLCCHIDRGGM